MLASTPPIPKTLIQKPDETHAGYGGRLLAAWRAANESEANDAVKNMRGIRSALLSFQVNCGIPARDAVGKTQEELTLLRTRTTRTPSGGSRTARFHRNGLVFK